MEAMFKLIKINNEKNKQNMITKQRIYITCSWGHIPKKESNQTKEWKNRHRYSQCLNTFKRNMIVHVR